MLPRKTVAPLGELTLTPESPHIMRAYNTIIARIIFIVFILKLYGLNRQFCSAASAFSPDKFCYLCTVSLSVKAFKSHCTSEIQFMKKPFLTVMDIVVRANHSFSGSTFGGINEKTNFKRNIL